ncbi:MAG: hypothetical protein ACK515_18610 [bacterium]|nr:hypothetical protein [Betaproteobacteria bacterium]
MRQRSTTPADRAAGNAADDRPDQVARGERATAAVHRLVHDLAGAFAARLDHPLHDGTAFHDARPVEMPVVATVGPGLAGQQYRCRGGHAQQACRRSGAASVGRRGARCIRFVAVHRRLARVWLPAPPSTRAPVR